MRNIIETIMFVYFLKEIFVDKFRAPCQLTRRYKKPAHNNCNFDVKDKQSNFIPFVFHNFSIYDCHLLLENLVDKRNEKVEFEVIPKTNEE